MKKTKSENINVRLSPKLRYGLELMARKQRRTISSCMEWVLEAAINSEDGLPSDWEMYLWDVDPEDRLCKLRENHPNWLTFEEEVYIKNKYYEKS